MYSVYLRSDYKFERAPKKVCKPPISAEASVWDILSQLNYSHPNSGNPLTPKGAELG